MQVKVYKILYHKCMEREQQTFGEILQEIMIDKKLNQSTLALKIGVKQSQVSEWLKGKSKPGYDNLRALCENLNVSAEKLLGLDK